MTPRADPNSPAAATLSDHRSDAARARLRRRNAAERRFHLYGLAAMLAALSALALLFVNVAVHGYTAFLTTEIRLAVALSPEVIDREGARDPETLSRANYRGLVRDSLSARFPEVSDRGPRRALARLVSSGADLVVRDAVLANPDLIGTTVELWVPADDDIDMLHKGRIDRDLPESERRVSDRVLAWVDSLAASGDIRVSFNTRFLTAGDSREPELAGIRGALTGSILTLLVTLLISFPIAVGAAIYLEEFAPRNRWTTLIEVNINNLAAVPSIVFGLLGLAVFLNLFHLPRSAPVVGGLTLALMTLPTIIIAGRAALLAVPPSIREAALGIGASPMQVVAHHVLPLAMPGILTGTIIGLARALGETAPLLMIGMVAFIVDVPQNLTDPATVLPVQIYLWADSPERGFLEKTWAAILVLLIFLVAMNALAVVLRRRFERRW